MNRTDRLKELLGLEALAVAAMSKAAEHRAALETEARAELLREGTAPTWRMPDLATVVLPVSKEQPVVTDAAALLAWMKQRYPSEVETIEQVRGAFQSALLRRAVVEGDAVVDPVTGEIVPGMTVRPGGIARTLTIKPSPEAKFVFAAVGTRVLDELMGSFVALPSAVSTDA